MKPGNGCKISCSKSKRDSKEGQLKASDIYLTYGYNNFLTQYRLKNKLEKSKRNSVETKRNNLK
jgi:hypothetical protein